MTKLFRNGQQALPARSFAEPDERKYPIDNDAHARNALLRVSIGDAFGEAEG
jgi:hypothetical protein